MLFVSGKLKKQKVGLNRQFHLDTPLWLASLGMTGKTQLLRVPVPNDKGLIDVCLYFQWISTDPALKRLKVSSSTEAWLQ